jgi:hypothetical protein
LDSAEEEIEALVFGYRKFMSPLAFLTMMEQIYWEKEDENSAFDFVFGYLIVFLPPESL